MDILYRNKSTKETILSKLYYFKVFSKDGSVFLNFKDEFGEHQYVAASAWEDTIMDKIKSNPIDISNITLSDFPAKESVSLDTSASEINIEDTKKVIDWIKSLSNTQSEYLSKQYAAFYNVVTNMSYNNVDACKFFLNQWSPKVISDIMDDVDKIKRNSEKRLEIDLV